ncbi:MAG: FHA domain-containing protein [Planctomycetes bacterium]|nr:FHA domain-containing protein [Planctomycetota bacterium]
MDLVACEECGFSANQPTRLRCAVCKRPLGGALPTPDPSRRRGSSPTRTWRRDLLLRRGARPFVIPFGKVTRIGRGTECEVRVSSPRVSRVHAELRWDGQQLSVRDLGSHNGTRVNDVRIDKVDLTNDDEIWIGPYRCIYRRLKGVDEDVLGRVDTELQALLDHEGAFEANVAERDLLELLQALEVQKRTGTLTLTESEVDDGTIVVQDGLLTHVSSGPLKGDRALRALLRRERGRLRLVNEVDAELSTNVTGDSLQDVLLESSKDDDSLMTSKFVVADLLDLDDEAPLEPEELDPSDETSPELDLGFGA